MSELNVYHHELRPNEYDEFYLKYEADKVIGLLKDKANYNEYAYKLKSEELADTCRFYEKELRHQKYKRCLAMAKECVNGEIKLKRVKMRDMNNHQFWQFDNDYWQKWNTCWLKIAEQFKESK